MLFVITVVFAGPILNFGFLTNIEKILFYLFIPRERLVVLTVGTRNVLRVPLELVDTTK